MGSWPGLYHLDPTDGNEGAGGAVQVLGMQRQVAEEGLLTSAREVTVEVMRARSGEERSRASGWTSGLSLLLESENRTREGNGYMPRTCRTEC